MWVLYLHKQWCGSGSGSRGLKSLIKWREKQSLTNKKKISQEIIFFKSEPKKSRCWCLLTDTSSLNLNLFFYFKKLKFFYKFFWFYWPGSGLDPDQDPDPHHCTMYISSSFNMMLKIVCKIPTEMRIFNFLSP